MKAIQTPPATPSNERARQPRASQGAEMIKQRIKQGIYKPGESLPSLRTLSRELNLSFPSIQRAVRQLEGEALLESRHGVGIRILESANCGNTPLHFGFVQPYFSRFSFALQHYLEEALDNRSNLCVVKSTHNDPERERREIERLLSSNINGLLVWPVDGDTNGQFLQEVSTHIPVVLVDRTLGDVRAPSVVLDYTGCAHEIVRHLYDTNRHRILVVCDPADISSFHQLKQGMQQEADSLGIGDSLKILDYPIVSLIESAYENNYQLADACYEYLAPMLKSGQYDALFCPQSEFFDQVFADSGHSKILNKLHCVTLRTPDGPPHSRRYHELNLVEWVLDTAGMLVKALDILQDMTLARTPLSNTVRLTIHKKEDSNVEQTLV